MYLFKSQAFGFGHEEINVNVTESEHSEEYEQNKWTDTEWSFIVSFPKRHAARKYTGQLSAARRKKAGNSISSLIGPCVRVRGLWLHFNNTPTCCAAESDTLCYRKRYDKVIREYGAVYYYLWAHAEGETLS